MESFTQGNEFFVEEKWQQAVQAYTAALTDPAIAGKALEARSTCHLKLGDWLNTAEDAGKAAQLNPSSAKAFLRKLNHI